MGCSCSTRGASEPHRDLPNLLDPPLPTLLGRTRSGNYPRLLASVHTRREKTSGAAPLVEVSCHASGGSRWHLELVAVSTDLKEKLQVPQFVATRCDLDGSGDLDPYELKQAAQVYGISFSASSADNADTGNALRVLMDGKPRISKERFAEMVASRAGTTSIRTVPHSLRGMALGQLQHLETLFIKTGWLAAQCEAFNTQNARAIAKGTKYRQNPNLYALNRTVPHSLRGMALGQLLHLEILFIETGWLAQCAAFNAENAQAISNGTKFRQNPNLYSLDTFVVTPMSKPGNCKAREKDKLETIAEARGMSSFSELVNPCGLLVHCFVSHYWGHDFSSTVTALDLWADANHHRMTSEKEALVFWICLFALNQHNVAEEVGEKPQQGPFNAALAQATGGAVMVLDEQIHPFSRIWCLFEISRLKCLEKPFELICSEGSLSQSETRGNQAVSTEMLEAMCEALWKVSAAKAESSVEADKYQIWAEIANKTVRGAIDQEDAKRFFETLIDQRDADFMESIFSDFHRYIKSLLSTTMLQLLLARGQYDSAAKCCLYGACYGPEQLTEICNRFAQETERKHWLNELLMQASRPSMAQLLLDLGADARAANKEGVTALHEAACHNHRAVAEILFEHRADARAKDNSGVTALIGAAHHGHVAMVTLLLDHRADVSARRNGGGTALMAAAAGGHVAVAKLLLEHGADAGAEDFAGSTAMMAAAARDHEAVAELLSRDLYGLRGLIWGLISL